MTEKFPARLHVLFARESPVGVVFRRGPSKQVCTFLWDREKDSFELGQWLKGRIYEKRSDLSPDGKYMIYFAMNGRWDSETEGSWTAISRVPWLKAISLYPKGDCWEGGGLFLDRDRFWLNDRYFSEDEILFETDEVRRDDSHKAEGQFGAEDRSVYYPRLMRDGWTLLERTGSGWNHATLFEKPLLKGWVLKIIAHEQLSPPKGKSCYWDEHELTNAKSGTRIECKDWEWAELDGSSLVWASKGCLYRSSIESAETLGTPKLLYDFNSLKFKRITAPY